MKHKWRFVAEVRVQDTDDYEHVWWCSFCGALKRSDTEHTKDSTYYVRATPRGRRDSNKEPKCKRTK